jgi:hypothetical protein
MKMATKKLILAQVLIEMATIADNLDSVAGRVLTAIKQANADTLEKFEALVDAAYKENGWQKGGGRPENGKAHTPVPGMVKQYMSEIRVAYSIGLPVLDYTSIGVLREDIRKKRGEVLAANIAGSPRPQELKGVTVKTEGKLNGSLFHDLITVHGALSPADKTAMEKTLNATLKKYQKIVGDTLKTTARPAGATAGSPEARPNPPRSAPANPVH